MKWCVPIVSSVLLLAGCAPGPVARAPVAHPTIVSLNPSTDAILADIAVPGQLLAISHYSHDPAATSMPLDLARRFSVTGGTVEEVLALDPDLVVASAFLAPATRAAFERLGIRVETFGIASTIDQSLAQVHALASLAGRAQQGDLLAGRISAAWAESEPEAVGFGSVKVSALLWQEGGIVPGPESLVAQMLDRSGFALHSAARGLGQGAYLPLEHVLADPPAVLLAASDERALSHPALGRLPHMQRAAFDPALLYCGGPSIIRALARLREIRRQL